MRVGPSVDLSKAQVGVGYVAIGRLGTTQPYGRLALSLSRFYNVACSLFTQLHFIVWCVEREYYFEEIRVFQAEHCHEYISME